MNDIKIDFAISAASDEPLSPELRFTCNRYEQIRILDPTNLDRPPISFYFLFGAPEQSLEGFVRRVIHELKGEYLKTTDRDMRIFSKRITVPGLKDEFNLFDKNTLVGKICNELKLNPDEKRPLHVQRFGELLPDAQPLSPLRGKDLIVFTIRFSLNDWRSKGRIQLLNWLSTSFFTSEALNDESPKVLVFWSLSDLEWKSGTIGVEDLRKELNSLAVPPIFLPELGLVTREEVDKWMNDIGIGSRQARSILQGMFKQGDAMDMELVEDWLNAIIENINQQLYE